MCMLNLAQATLCVCVCVCVYVCVVVDIDNDNRVCLVPLSGHSDYQTDYINASYVDVGCRKVYNKMSHTFLLFLQGYSTPRKFLATQGNFIIIFLTLLLPEVTPSISHKVLCQRLWWTSGGWCGRRDLPLLS